MADTSPGAVCAELPSCNADKHRVRCPKAVATVTIEQIVTRAEMLGGEPVVFDREGNPYTVGGQPLAGRSATSAEGRVASSQRHVLSAKDYFDTMRDLAADPASVDAAERAYNATRGRVPSRSTTEHDDEGRA